MKCIRAHQIISAIQKKGSKDLTDEERKFLAKQDIIESIDPDDYRVLSRKASRISSVERSLEMVRSERSEKQSKMQLIIAFLASRWHRFWSVIFHFGRSGIKNKEIERDRLQGLIEEVEADINRLESEQEELEAIKLRHDTLQGCGAHYCATTETGERILKALTAALERLDDVDLVTFLDGREELFQNAREQLAARAVMLNYLRDTSFDNSQEVHNFALALSAIDGKPDEVWARAKVVNDFLHGEGWKSYRRLRPTAIVTCHNGGIEKLRDELVETFLMMVEDGHKKSYNTWLEAAQVMRLPGATLRERYNRFELFQTELGERQWRKRSTATGHVAVALARRDGPPGELSEAFRSLEKAIIATGRRDDCVETGIAALIMMDHPGSDEERADRFALAFTAIQKHGWDKRTDRYPAAAIVAAMPGTVVENALLLLEVCEMVEGGSFENHTDFRTNLALSLLGGSHQVLNGSDHVLKHFATNIIFVYEHQLRQQRRVQRKQEEQRRRQRSRRRRSSSDSPFSPLSPFGGFF